ncbi:MAG: hypothetical protein WCW13_02545 [archaeon]|jgi:hypothetical protein
MPFGIGVQEVVVLIIIGAIVFFFGRNKIKEWLSLGKEIKAEASKPTKKA